MNLHKLAKKGEFCCNNGLCIDSENRCDNSIDCVDHSDEEDCELVKFLTFRYKLDRPPDPETIKRFPISKIRHSTNVDVSVELFNIFDINEVTSEVSVIFTVFLTCRDPRLKFMFIKNDKEKNVIDDKICIPDIIFGNQKEFISEFKGKLKVSKEGKHVSNSREILNMEEVYEGSENAIAMKNSYQIKFICSFDNIDLYPFDQEFCSSTLSLLGLPTNLST